MNFCRSGRTPVFAETYILHWRKIKKTDMKRKRQSFWRWRWETFCLNSPNVSSFWTTRGKDSLPHFIFNSRLELIDTPKQWRVQWELANCFLKRATKSDCWKFYICDSHRINCLICFDVWPVSEKPPTLSCNRRVKRPRQLRLLTPIHQFEAKDETILNLHYWPLLAGLQLPDKTTVTLSSPLVCFLG